MAANDVEPQIQKAINAGVAAEVRFAFRTGFEKAFVGFSRKHPQGMIARQQFDAGYRKILADGTVDSIRRKWTSTAK